MGSDAHEQGDHGDEVEQEVRLLPIELIAVPGGRGAGVRGGARNRGPVVEQAVHGEDEEI